MNHPVQDPPLLRKEEFDDKKRKKGKKERSLKRNIFPYIYLSVSDGIAHDRK